MSVSQAYNSLRNALARDAKKERLGDNPAFGAPSDRDYWVADDQINAMTNTQLLTSLEAHEETLP